MIADLSVDTTRNQLIVNTLAEYPTQQHALLCHLQTQVEALAKLIPGSKILIHKTKPKEREAIIAGLIDGSVRTVVTTWKLFHKGIDLAELEILFLCAPTRSKAQIKQSAGRLMRTSTKIDKHPVIVDFVDKQIDTLKYQWYTRARILKGL